MDSILPEAIGDLSFRRMTEADDEFIFQTIKATMAEYVTLTYGPWEDEFQRRVIKEDTHYEPMRAIVKDRRDIGLLTVERQADCLWIDQLYVLPAYQGQGLGSMIIDRLKQVAADEGLPLRLSVLASNSSARKLYEREGFTVFEQTDKRTRMEFKPV